jgi:hypothetical protein
MKLLVAFTKACLNTNLMTFDLDNRDFGSVDNAYPKIARITRFAFFYSKDIIRGRWPEAEPLILKNVYWSYWYAFYIIRGRWPEAEPIIMKDGYFRQEYEKTFGIKEYRIS